ncbi:MAG: argininosuccinate lyase [Anaerolineaceae bacterium]|nr:argininosuccinate lyase [Anaerolineaceae bacterium]
MKLWQVDSEFSASAEADLLNNSLPVDQRMNLVDVIGSKAWTKNLARYGILTKDEMDQMLDGLDQIQEEFESKTFTYLADDEDIHTAVERRLGELIGALAGKLHSGRSRNDQVATDFRMWVLGAAQEMVNTMEQYQNALIRRAEKDMGIIFPGYTHFQQAQPILLSHWWLSHFWAIQRDKIRLNNLISMTDSMPLGSGALSGSGFAFDRHALATDLGFAEPTPNSLDAISDRDFAVEFLFITSLTGTHLSRMAEALVLFCSKEFGFMQFTDQFSTGSSLMPQKRNPDMMELVRGKAGTLLGKLTGLMATLKGLPSAYDKDLQEDKEPVFEAFDTLQLLLKVCIQAIPGITVYPEKILNKMDPAMLATDLADYLVEKNVPFREAHHAIAKAVKVAEELNLSLQHLPLDQWQRIHPVCDDEILDLFTFERSIARKDSWGGTSKRSVTEQLAYAKRKLSA